VQAKKIYLCASQFNGPVAQLNTCLPAGREQQSGMFYVSVIRSDVDGRFYVGICENLERRLREHNSGKTFSTKGYRPWKIFFYEQYPTRIAARKREKFLKGGSGKELIKNKWSGSSAEYLPAGRQGATVSHKE